ncbi:CWF19-like protein 2 [Macadamia integrifolia]|uniref:CWF19-like protein 2 n=1 Tax=Macadamia integrifolia TaxID=60698 RepID=UPI001C4EC4D3|nr:CWF19-like protein 2 [Macadamia integrifolia]XP_042486716.1 CWF19-like protein 2 [Macadamia integrifolia]XP_042486717.1 CWF19-like protein 2 [Macadamia integrifolia]
MFAGVKYIPRDQVNAVEPDKTLDSSVKKKKSGNRKGKHRREKSSSYYSSDDEEIEKLSKSSSRKKHWYSSDEYSTSSLSGSESESGSDYDDRKHQKRRKKKKCDESSSDDRTKKRSKRSKKGYSSGKPESGSEREGVNHSSGGKEKSRKERRIYGIEKSKKRKDKQAIGEDLSDDGENSPSIDKKELARKEMGLEWMVKPAQITERTSTQANDHIEEPKFEEVKKPNPRELNPYLKDNGSGYPEKGNGTNIGGEEHLSSSVVGDGGASWRLKALKRAKEQATREGLKLDEVVEERWGSLGQLAVSAASRAAAPSRAHLGAIKDRKRGVAEKHKNVADDQSKNPEKLPGESREYLKDISLRHSEMRAPRVHDSLSWRKSKGQKMSSEDAGLISVAASSLNKFANDGSFILEFSHHQNKDDGSMGSSHANYERDKYTDSAVVSSKTDKPSEDSPVVTQGLSVNQLAAKALQLRLKGKNEEAERLMKEAENLKGKQDGGDRFVSEEANETSRRVFLRDVSLQKKKKEEDADAHLAQKIMQNKKFSVSGQADDEYDFDDGPRRKRKQKRGEEPNHKLDERRLSSRILTQQERCQFCFENPKRPKHLLVSIANFTYLMLPPWQPVVQGHCCILPMLHESATRNIDNNVWEEIRNFKKCLIMMFAKQGKDVVFLETVMGLAQQRRHCLVECIPLPQDIARQAPLYFKKAIDEAEDEWSQHNAKKLIDTSEKGLRGSIPKDFPYFHVEFGLNKGFVHVIDDEQQFKSSLGLNVIRGMLHLPEEDMYRRRKYDSVDVQSQAVSSFAREWGSFDWTKQLD